jgi:DNA gyrase subunit A
VNFTRNVDDSLDEPLVLPSAIPNLLVNGVSGIAVGMATSIPPHNLAEVIDALSYLLENWQKLDDITVGDLMKFIKGPDFPTGGIILQEHEQDEILAAYATGKGRITLRGRVGIEEMSRGKSRLLITELPYMSNKSALIERIAELSREGHLEGISDLRDESDRQGMRVVIELNKAADAEVVLR